MHGKIINGIVVLMFVLGLSVANGIAVEKAASEPPKGYASPREAFEAYRKARNQKDWRTLFFCMTPDLQNRQVIGLWYESWELAEGSEKEVFAAWAKHNLDGIRADYQKLYSKKHGFDFERLKAEQEKWYAEQEKRRKRYYETHPEVPKDSVVSDHLLLKPGEKAGGPEGPAEDHQLLQEVFLQRVTDKAGFYEEIMKIGVDVHNSYLGDPNVGELEQLRTTDDTATGRVAITRQIGLETDAKGKETKIMDTARSSIHFRKLAGKWFLDKAMPELKNGQSPNGVYMVLPPMEPKR